MRYQSLALVGAGDRRRHRLRHALRGTDQPAHPRPGARAPAGWPAATTTTRVDVQDQQRGRESSPTPSTTWGTEIQKAFAEIQRQADVNKELFMGSIRMLANAIDEKDPVHARPLRARRLLLDADGAGTWGCRRRRWRTSTSPASSTTSARSASRTDPAQAGRPHRGRVRDHEAAPAQGRAHPRGGAPAQGDGGRRASCTTRTGTAAAIRTA